MTVAASPAVGATGEQAACADAVVRDWSDNGLVDRDYPLGCYSLAIERLPPDVRDYSSAGDEINRALAVAVNRPAPRRPDRTLADSSRVEDAGTAALAALPNSLLVLGAVAALVLAAGAGGYLARRIREDA